MKCHLGCDHLRGDPACDAEACARPGCDQPRLLFSSFCSPWCALPVSVAEDQAYEDYREARLTDLG